MDIPLRLYKGAVYIPTSHRVEEHGFYVYNAPIASVPVEKTEDLRDAILAAVARGNPPISMDHARTFRNSKNSPQLKATGARSWLALDRQTKGFWSLVEDDGLYAIHVDRPMATHGWHEDKTKRVSFPPGTALDDVIDRLVVMIQDCERQ